VSESEEPGTDAVPAVLVGEVVDDDAGAQLPADWDDWTSIDLGMSNFDHRIDDGLDAALRGGKVYAIHAAWEFNGRVWWADGGFHEQVWRYNQPVAVVRAATLPDLMAEVNDAWGWD
jgi:hypothetical protein